MSEESLCPICEKRPRDAKTRNSPTGHWCLPCQCEFDDIDREGSGVIPDEAVEAAWSAMPKESYVDTKEHVRAMLEAAAPYAAQHSNHARHIANCPACLTAYGWTLASAWSEGELRGYWASVAERYPELEQLPGNPYRPTA